MHRILHHFRLASTCAHRQSRQAGFTLVEFILYFALASALFTVVGGLFISILESRTTISAVTSLDRDGQFVIARLRYDIQRATEVSSPSALGESASVLGLVIDGQPWTYQVEAGKLSIFRGGVSDVLHDQTIVESFVVRRMGSEGGTPLVEIDLELRSGIQEDGGERSRSFETTVGLR